MTQIATAPHSAMTDPERWVDDHGDVLYRFALTRLNGDAAMAQDMVQETFLAAVKSRERFSGRSSERTWLVGILKHKTIDYIRKASRERSYGEEEDLDRFEQEHFDNMGHWRHIPVEWWTHPAKSMERQEFWGVLQECLGKLKPVHQRAFVLREMEETEGEEICKLMGISETNLWVILYRARIQLRACLEENWFKTTTPREGSKC